MMFRACDCLDCLDCVTEGLGAWFTLPGHAPGPRYGLQRSLVKLAQENPKHLMFGYESVSDEVSPAM
jgi:hypothetical protein